MIGFVAISGYLDDDKVNAPTVTGDPLIGALLGEYRVLSRLGEGGMGVVYRGEQEMLSKAVAIKVLRVEVSDATNVKRLLEEARAVTAAHHPNIIDIFSFGQAPTGQQYFVMECLEGEPLDIWLRDSARPSLEEIAHILQQVASGLGAAHSAGVIHRDLKPSNIFLARLSDGTRFVKILDFGLAKRGAPNAGVRSTSIVGTPLYRAPEQAKGAEVGPWTDLYALGCIAYELVAGAPPLVGAGILETLELHITKTPKRLSELDPTVPPDFSALVCELLEKLPEKRPKSAAAVRRSLDRIIRQLSTARTRGTGIQALVPTPQEGLRIAKTTSVVIRRPSEVPWRFVAPPLVLLVLAALAYLFRPMPAAIPEPVLPPPPEAVRVPISSPEPEDSTIGPLVTPRPRSVKPIRAADVEKRIEKLRTKARAVLTDAPARIALLQLDELWADLKKGASPDQLSRELDDFEKRMFVGGK